MLVAIAFLLVAQGALGQNNCSSMDPFATAEKRLRRLLFCNYDPAVIPLNPPDVTHVTAEVSLDLKHLVMVCKIQPFMNNFSSIILMQSADMNTLQVTAWLTTVKFFFQVFGLVLNICSIVLERWKFQVERIRVWTANVPHCCAHRYLDARPHSF